MRRFQGTLTALVTPLRDGSVDDNALRELVERQIAGGIDGLVPCGTTGEGAVLTDEEAAQVVRVVVEQARGRVPVVAGVGTVSTHRTIRLAEQAKAGGADGLLVVAPYYNKPTQAGLEAHFEAVLTRVPLPTILYNIPSRTGVDVGMEVIEKLARLPQLVGVKEATGNILRSQQLIARLGDRLDILSGDDALTLGILAVGGTGVISVTSNLAPKLVSDVVRLALRGDYAGARAAHLALLPLHEVLFVETNPGPVKAAMAMRGWLGREVRLPLVWPSDESIRRVSAVMSQLGLGS